MSEDAENRQPRYPELDLLWNRGYSVLCRISQMLNLPQRLDAFKVYSQAHPLTVMSIALAMAVCSIPVGLFLMFVLGSLLFTFTGFVIVEGFLLAAGCMVLGACLLVCVFFGSGILVLLGLLYTLTQVTRTTLHGVSTSTQLQVQLKRLKEARWVDVPMVMIGIVTDITGLVVSIVIQQIRATVSKLPLPGVATENPKSFGKNPDDPVNVENIHRDNN